MNVLDPTPADVEIRPQPARDRPFARLLPEATYRLQLHREFTFREACKIVQYLAALGISDCYTSPFFKARPGSMHGYDIVDHASFNPEVGNEQEFDDFTKELHFHGMGHIVDVVPNHMGVAGDENAWWNDVLENGPGSPCAAFFDIDWMPLKPDLANKVLLPILGAQFGQVLEEGSLVLTFEEGALSLRCYERRLPIAPHTWLRVLKLRVDDLEQQLGIEDTRLHEYQSILSSIAHLSPPSETNPERVSERRRERDVICRRLAELCTSSAEIRDFVSENVRIFNGAVENPASFDRLEELLDDQAYRLAYWQVAADEINYRRFFDVNELAAICMENPEVFRETHRMVMRLLGEGRINGLRIDHPDGLYDPLEYLRKLQSARQEQLAVDAVLDDKPLYLVVEKILEPGERLPAGWPVHGTTGYEFLNALNGLFVDRAQVKAFNRIYARFVSQQVDFKELVYRCKKLIMQVSMSSEVSVLANQLDRISERNRRSRDFTLNSLTAAIREIIACFPVYRTYVNENCVSERDRHYIELAVGRARRKNPATSASIFNFIRDILMLKFPDRTGDIAQSALRAFVGRFQQVTGPVMAKAVEDTAFYIYNRLASLNEVGGDPERFGITVAAFHQQNIDRQLHWPCALLATSTHDTKRSEDVRARINVLSELPGDWKTHLARWARCNKRHKQEIDGEPAPSRNDEYLLYQTLIGTWPFEPFQGNEQETFLARMQEYALKAAHEAKVHTSWISPNEPYEQATRDFLAAILAPSSRNLFLADFVPFAVSIADLAIWNSLSQTLLKLTSPGVPDIYQGTELFDFRLVDPDNRRPVDFVHRRQLLDALEQRVDESATGLAHLAGELVAGRTDGRIKLFVIRQLLNYRREHPDLFTSGQYLPVELAGSRRENACAFCRKSGDAAVIVIAPRLVTRLVGISGQPPLGPTSWEDTRLIVPKGLTGGQFINLFTGEVLPASDDLDSATLPLAAALMTFPVAALVYVPASR